MGLVHAGICVYIHDQLNYRARSMYVYTAIATYIHNYAHFWHNCIIRSRKNNIVDSKD